MSASIVSITIFFLVSIAFGLIVFSPLANTKHTGVGFHKVVQGLSFASVLIALILQLIGALVLTPVVMLMGGTLIISVLTYFWHQDEKNPLMWIFYVLQSLFLTAIFFFLVTALTPFLFLLSSAALLGVITYAMVLGHWYLVTPRLSEKPLLIATKIMWAILVIKMGGSAIAQAQASDFFTQGTTLGQGYMFNWLLLVMRWGWGYLIIGIMSYFSWRLIAMRSIQSATGVLYVMCFFVFVGELISTYLYYNYGLYL